MGATHQGLCEGRAYDALLLTSTRIALRVCRPVVEHTIEADPGAESHVFGSGEADRRAGQGTGAPRSSRGLLRGGTWSSGCRESAASVARIDYHHAIWSLAKKTGAFARYRWREELSRAWSSVAPLWSSVAPLMC
jgi:hypothetical protein